MEIQKIPSKLFILSSIDLKDDIEEVSEIRIVPIKCVLNGKIETHEGFWSSSSHSMYSVEQLRCV